MSILKITAAEVLPDGRVQLRIRDEGDTEKQWVQDYVIASGDLATLVFEGTSMTLGIKGEFVALPPTAQKAREQSAA